MTGPADGGSETSGESGELLRARLTVTPHQESHCVLVEEAGATDDVVHNFKSGGSNGSTPDDEGNEDFKLGCCNTVLTETDGKSQKYFKAEANGKCICPIFNESHAVSDIRRVKSGSLIMMVTVQDRNELRELITDLRAIDASISVDWLVKGREDRSTTEIDVNSITTKQQEALETAIEEGYYESPRETNLGALANELDISESAMSQRLNAAEMKLVKSFMDEDD